MANHPEAAPLRLAYFGYSEPRDLGIEYQPIKTAAGGSFPKDPPPGWYAISVNFVRGFPHFTYAGDGTHVPLARDELIAFQKLKPVAMAGFSIYIYHVEE